MASVVGGGELPAVVVEHTRHITGQICRTELERLPWQSTGFSWSQASASCTPSAQSGDVTRVGCVPVVALVFVVMVVELLHVPQVPGHSTSTNANVGSPHRWAIRAHPALSALPLQTAAGAVVC